MSFTFALALGLSQALTDARATLTRSVLDGAPPLRPGEMWGILRPLSPEDRLTLIVLARRMGAYNDQHMLLSEILSAPAREDQ